jgi:hypothetical protein
MMRLTWSFLSFELRKNDEMRNVYCGEESLYLYFRSYGDKTISSCVADGFLALLDVAIGVEQQFPPELCVENEATIDIGVDRELTLTVDGKAVPALICPNIRGDNATPRGQTVLSYDMMLSDELGGVATTFNNMDFPTTTLRREYVSTMQKMATSYGERTSSECATGPAYVLLDPEVRQLVAAAGIQKLKGKDAVGVYVKARAAQVSILKQASEAGTLPFVLRRENVSKMDSWRCSVHELLEENDLTLTKQLVDPAQFASIAARYRVVRAEDAAALLTLSMNRCFEVMNRGVREGIEERNNERSPLCRATLRAQAISPRCTIPYTRFVNYERYTNGTTRFAFDTTASLDSSGESRTSARNLPECCLGRGIESQASLRCGGGATSSFGSSTSWVARGRGYAEDSVLLQHEEAP